MPEDLTCGPLSTNVLVTDRSINGLRAVHVEISGAKVDGVGHKLNVTVWVPNEGSRHDIGMAAVESARAFAAQTLRSELE